MTSPVLLISFPHSYFRTFDKDNDGFLTTEELRKMMKGRMSKKDLESMVRDADSDKDGFINCKGWRGKKLKIFH